MGTHAEDEEVGEFLPPRDFEEAATRLAGAEETLDRLDALLQGLLNSQVAGPAPAAARPPVEPDDTFEPYYPSLEAWVQEFFVVAFARVLGGPLGHWCVQWWDHAEAILRLEALWRTFEAARQEPVAGMAVWLAHHLDHHLPLLLSSAGPFGQCNPDAHRPLDPFPVIPAPDDWWQPMTATTT